MPVTLGKAGHCDSDHLFSSKLQYHKSTRTVIHGLSRSFIKTANLELTKSLIFHTSLPVFGTSSPLCFPSLFYPNPYPLAVFIYSFPSIHKYLLHPCYELGTVLGTEDTAENTSDKSLALTELEATECLLNVELLTQSPSGSSPRSVLHHPSVMPIVPAGIL